MTSLLTLNRLFFLTQYEGQLYYVLLNVKEPLINYILSLRDLKRTDTRRALQQMALVLCKKCNAVDVRFRPRPAGLAGGLALSVTSFHHAISMLSSLSLDCKPACKPEILYN